MPNGPAARSPDPKRPAPLGYDDDWVAAQGLDLQPHEHALESFLKDGKAII